MHHSGVLLNRTKFDSGLLLRVGLPGPAAEQVSRPGQFFLLRCGAGWSPYLRRSLFPSNIDRHTIAFWGDPAENDGLGWLASQPDGAALDLLGPFGNGFSLHAQQKRLLLAAEGARVAPLLALIVPQLERRGSVGLLLEAPTPAHLLPPVVLPPAVEYYTATTDGPAGHARNLDEIMPRALQWADVVCAAGRIDFLRRLKRQVDQIRYGVRSGFVQVLAPVPLPCGVGACLACLVECGRGWHRACVRGPVFDLVELAL